MDFAPDELRILAILLRIPALAGRVEDLLERIGSDSRGGFSLGVAAESSNPLVSGLASFFLQAGFLPEARIDFEPSPSEAHGAIYAVVLWMNREGFGPYILFNDGVTEGAEFVVHAEVD